MYKFYLGNNLHSIKNTWEELYEFEFIKVSDLLRRFRKGEINLHETRIRIVQLLLDITPPKRGKTGEANHMPENVYKISLEIGFFFKIEYKDKEVLTRFPDELLKELNHKFPEDMEESTYVKIARNMERKVKLDIVFGKMFLTAIYNGVTHFKPFEFSTVRGILKTSLLTMQFIDAQKLTVNYINGGSSKILSLLCGTLFQAGYSRLNASNLAPQFDKISLSIKEGVLLNFIGINNYIARRTKYWILFDGSYISQIKNIDSPGLADYFCLFTKSIYDDDRINQNTGLFQFLDMLLKELNN